MSVKVDVVGTLNDLGESDDIQVVAARVDEPLQPAQPRPGATCYVTAPSAECSRTASTWRCGRTQPSGRQPRNTWIALPILAAVVFTTSFGLAPIEFTSIAGAILMVVTRVLTPRAARALTGPDRWGWG